MKSVKDIIKEKRKEYGMTMKELADNLGVSSGTISRWESGEIYNMRRDAIASLAKTLDISPAILIGCTSDDSTPHQSSTATEYEILLKKIPDLYEAIKLYSALDPYDRSEIRGEMKGMLRNPKYKPSIKEKTIG